MSDRSDPSTLRSDRSGSPPLQPVDTELPAGDGRYVVKSEIARGGMGAVLRVHDVELQRELAVKVLLDRHSAADEFSRRFLDEALIHARLQHPGVTPLHAMGRFPDGRLFIAMKLVEGRTFSAILRSRSDGSNETAHALTVFEQVCRTVAYAHSRGIIHRDLKPLNIMVGAFGEVQVMDWGLARRLRDGPPAPVVAPEPRDPAPEEDDATLVDRRLTTAGTAVGTPAYMAPEQARGEIDRLDERCDVFGLGAILCEILTGRPPFGDADGRNAFEQARRAELEPAFDRLEACPVDGELVALARRCLAERPEDRPRDAAAVSAELTAYLEGVQERLKAARIERAKAETRAGEETKRRRLTVLLAGAVLTLGLGGASAWVWYQRDRAESAARKLLADERLRRDMEASLAQVRALQSRDRLGEAGAVLAETERRLTEDETGSLAPAVAAVRADFELQSRLEAIRSDKASVVGGRLDEAGAERAYERAFAEPGPIRASEPASESARRIRESPIRVALVAALDDWAGSVTDRSRLARLLSIARWADPDPWRDRARDPAIWESRDALAALVAEPAAARQSASLQTVLAARLRKVGGDPLPLLRAALGRHPQDFWLNLEMSAAIGSVSAADGPGYLRAALAVRPGSSAVLNNLGVALYGLNRLDEAQTEFDRAIAADPRNPKPHVNLGLVLARRSRREEGVERFRRAAALAPDLFEAHYNLGRALQDLRRPAEAESAYRKAAGIDPGHANTRNNLGNVLKGMGRLDEAIVEFRKAAALDPKSFLPRYGLAGVLRQTGKLVEAATAYEEAIERAPDRPEPHGELGITLRRLGRFEAAAQEAQKAIERMPADHPFAAGARAELQACRRLIALDAKLPAVLDGSTRPSDVNEQLELAELCLEYKRLCVPAARLYEDALNAAPAAGADLAAAHRERAARAALAAALGRGSDTAAIDDAERAHWWKLARDWLRADLIAWRARVESGSPADRTAAGAAMLRRKADPDLAALRTDDALNRLPADEARAWRTLWADEAALLTATAEPK